MAKKTVATLQTGKEGRSRQVKKDVLILRLSKWLSHLRLVLMFLMNKWFLTKKFRTSLRNNIIF